MNKTSADLILDGEFVELVTHFNRTQDVNLFTTLLSTFFVLLYRYTGREDVVTGSVVTTSARGNSGNYFIQKTLQSRLSGESKFIDILATVKAASAETYNSQEAIFEKTGAGPVQGGVADLSQISNVAVAYTDEDLSVSPNHDLLSNRVSGFQLAFIFNKTLQGIRLKIQFDADAYSDGTVALIVGHFKRVLKSLIETPNQSIGAIPMLTSAENYDILVRFNNTVVPYGYEKSIVGLFEEQANKTPGNVALLQGDLTITYQEVNARANQLARYLKKLNIKNGDCVGLLMSRGFDMIIGMYAILKTGGAYVPIDPEYPIDRQEYIVSNSMVKLIVADNGYPLQNAVPPEQFINITMLNLGDMGFENLDTVISCHQLAYTIYTSGSTGRPKGVMIAHHSVVNLIQWVNKEFVIGESDRLLFITSMCFDLSVYDVFGMLSSGGSIVIVHQNELVDAQLLREMLYRYQITFWDSVPTTMNYLVRALEDLDSLYIQQKLRLVFLSGDWIPVNLPGRIAKYFPNAQVVSLGGATEGTVWSNFYVVKKDESNYNSIPYGRPINNNFFYILNEHLQPAPVGVIGELYIAGAGVALGYTNDLVKTNYSFLKDPFNAGLGGRMYRTGDLGKMSASLNMIFLGRKDTQVKINGFRVELGEIEATIAQSELVSQNVVVAKQDKAGTKRLVSYVVAKKGYDKAKVITFLRARLPEYMVPAVWLEVANLPLTSNGKADRKSLPEVNFELADEDELIAPVTELQKQLLTFWKRVLSIEKAGINSNFFALGGHSLLAVEIMTVIEKATGKKLPISLLFQYPTVKALSAYIEKDASSVNKWKSLVQIKPSGNKIPFYIVHGIGLNVLNFKSLISHIDPEQPVFGFQAKGLDGKEQPLDNIVGVAKYYVSELIDHNPSGPLAIGGYSIGGFIAMEMAHQLELMGRPVKFLAIFDTDADYSKGHNKLLPQKLNIPEIRRFSQSLTNYPLQTMYNLKQNLKRHFRGPENTNDQLVLARRSDSKSFYDHMKEIRLKLESATDQHQISPINGRIHLFRASRCIHLTKDKQYLGWRKYATQGVEEFEIPGDHTTIFHPRNVSTFGKLLQNALDNSLMA